MQFVIRLFFLGLTLSRPLQAQQDSSVAGPMAGISDAGKHLTDPYVTAGDRAYLIGTQDGDFPDLGDHVPGEMGGLWVHPIKLIDGFKATVTDSATGQTRELSSSHEFINYPYGNQFRYGDVLDGLALERFQFSPDGYPGVVVQYHFTNNAARPRNLMLQLTVKTDLRPVWLSEKLGITDAPDTVTWQAANGRWVARDIRHRWFAVWGPATPIPARRLPNPSPLETRGMGQTVAASYIIRVPPRDTASLSLVFAGSTRSAAAAAQAFGQIAGRQARLLEEKKAHYASLIHRARIRIPDPRLQQVYDWVRINTQWLVRDVPGMGRGLGAGLMEYPWWFGTDGAYTLQALLATGGFELAKQNLRLLRAVSARTNGNGRIIHEVTTNGAVFNPGNTQETAQFIMTVGKAIRWSGDRSFAREMYPAMKQGLHWLLTDMDKNRNLFPGGYGITEILGLNAELIDASVYTQQALVATAQVANLLGDKTSVRRYGRLAEQLERKINDRFWLEQDSSYADFYGTRNQAVSATEGVIKQIGLKGEDSLTQRQREMRQRYQQLKEKLSAMPDTTRGWITNKNWVVATPMETGIAPRERAIRVLDLIRKNDVGEYGPYLSAVDRQAMMTISTGVLAVSEGTYGRADEALWYMNKIVETFGRRLPGSISEMMPDYGCFVQGWTLYGIVVPLVQHIFGIEPDAVRRTVVLEPHLPRGWEDISIEDLPLGTNSISFGRAKTEKGIEYWIDSRESGWHFVLKPPMQTGAQYYLNGTLVQFDSTGLRLTGRQNRILVVTP